MVFLNNIIFVIPVQPVRLGSECPADDLSTCPVHHTCQTCSLEQDCYWTATEHCSNNASAALIPPVPPPPPSSSAEGHTVTTPIAEKPKCKEACSQLTSCYNCTQQECIWCQNEERCVDKTAYTASFPYGQCREWSTQGSRCRITPGNSYIIT